jgi:hypothetical protein
MQVIAACVILGVWYFTAAFFGVVGFILQYWAAFLVVSFVIVIALWTRVQDSKGL